MMMMMMTKPMMMMVFEILFVLIKRWCYRPTLKCVTTYNVFACFHDCITSNQYNVYIVARLPIGSKADIEVCAYIISGQTFERRAAIRTVR